MRIAFHDNAGRINRVVDVPDMTPLENVVPAGERGIVVEQGVLDSTHYVDIETMECTPLPLKPSPHHVWDYAAASYVLNLEDAERAAREERDRRIAVTDWTQLPDVPAETREAYVSYRQALRDVPEQTGFPMDIEWPDIP